MRIFCIRKRIYDGRNIFTYYRTFYPINSQFRSLQNLVVLKIIRIWKKKLKRNIITKEWFNNVLFGANCFFYETSDIFFISKFYNIYKSLFISQVFPYQFMFYDFLPMRWSEWMLLFQWCDFFFERTVDVSMSKTVTVGTLVRLNSERSGLRASVVPACKVELEPVAGSISSLKNISIAFEKDFKSFLVKPFILSPKPLPVWAPGFLLHSL